MKAIIKYSLLSPLILLSQHALAEIIGSRHGSIPASPDSTLVESGFTVTASHANDSTIKNDYPGSFDLVVTSPAKGGIWTIYIEGNTSPRSNGVSSVIGEANADAGSALDRDDNGRLQVSVLHYLHRMQNNALVIGLLDPAGPLDNSNVANDETSQFLGATLVNNPTIGFPDYALGAAFFYKPSPSAPDITLLMTSSHGLGDNPNKSYSSLFDVSENGKGVFLAGEATWKLNQKTLKLGAWVNTADHTLLDGSPGTKNNYGFYGLVDGSFNSINWNIRFGMANDKVSEAANFIGLAVERNFNKITMGAGITRTGLSDKVTTAGMDDSTQAEIYAKYEVHKSLFISPSIQHIRNSGFDSSGTTFKKNLNVFSLRLQYNI